MCSVRKSGLTRNSLTPQRKLNPIVNKHLNLRYLYEFLYGWLISAYNRADLFLTEHHSMTEYLKSKGKGHSGPSKKAGLSGNVKNKKKKDRSSNTRSYARDIAYCQAVQSMCGGYYKVTTPLIYCCALNIGFLLWPNKAFVS